MSEISYEPPKDYKKYLIISLAILFSLGIVIFLFITAKRMNPAVKNSNESADEKTGDKKVLTPEEVRQALTKTTDENQSNENSQIVSDEQIQDSLKKEVPEASKPEEPKPEEAKPLTNEEIQASLNKRL